MSCNQQTPNPPTPTASAWQALTCLAVAPLGGAKEERPTPNVHFNKPVILRADGDGALPLALVLAIPRDASSAAIRCHVTLASELSVGRWTLDVGRFPSFSE